ncbi:MAG: mevalonate kinase [Anaerolineae bacterium]|nr:mevalonate kinase [Anaerolineae bacterium]
MRHALTFEPGKDHSQNTLLHIAQLTFAHFGLAHPPDCIIILESEIPMGSGLGSGAAVSTAIARALALFLDRPLTVEALNTLVYETEKVHHGTPSGIDNTVIVYEQPVFFLRAQPIERLRIARPFTLLVGDSGHSTPTKITVGDVRRLLETALERTSPLIHRIGEIVRAARQSIEQGTLAELGTLMNENHELLQKLTVSSPALDILCEAALEAGALGAKASGGGRGGNMLALVEAARAAHVQHALKAAGATQVIQTTVKP